MKKTITDCFEYAKATTKVFGGVSENEWAIKAGIWAAELTDRGYQPHAVKLAFRKWCGSNEMFPEFKNILEMLNPPREMLGGATVGSDDFSAKADNQKNNCLAYAAANKWFDVNNDARLSAFQGGYEGELRKWLVVKYFEKARAGLISGRFEVGNEYSLDRFENIDVPRWIIESWLAKEAERKECRAAINRGGSGFKRIGSAVG